MLRNCCTTWASTYGKSSFSSRPVGAQTSRRRRRRRTRTYATSSSTPLDTDSRCVPSRPRSFDASHANVPRAMARINQRMRTPPTRSFGTAYSHCSDRARRRYERRVPRPATARGSSSSGRTATSIPRDSYRSPSVSLSGFDTHADELSQQNVLVGQLSDAITAFLTQVGTTPRADDVVVMVYSEFGRRVEANGGEGTDHGTSAPVFVAGNRVAGGFYGEQPSLTNLVQGDLAVVVDFRDVYASMLEDVLGAEAPKILNNWSTKLDLITPASS